MSKISNHNSLDSWQNVFWYCIITMTTVGYGDRTAITQPARLVVFALMMWGFLWNAIFIRTVFPLITLNEREMKSLNMFTRTHTRDELMEVCSRVIVRCLKIYKFLKKNKIKFRKIDILQQQIITILRSTRKIRNELNSLILQTNYFSNDIVGKLCNNVDMAAMVVKLQNEIDKVYQKIFTIQFKIDQDNPLKPLIGNQNKIYDSLIKIIPGKVEENYEKKTQTENDHELWTLYKEVPGYV